MDPTLIIKELGGGLAAVVIVAQALVIILQNRRNEQLVNRLLDCANASANQSKEMHEKTLSAVGALTTATQANNATTQAAVALMEKERGRG